MSPVLVYITSSIAEYLAKAIFYYYNKPWLDVRVTSQAAICRYRLINIARKIDRGEEVTLPLYLAEEEYLFIVSYLKDAIVEHPEDIMLYAAGILFGRSNLD